MTQSLSFHRCVKTSWGDESRVSIILMNLRSGVWLSEKKWFQDCVEASVESDSCGMWAITSCLRSLWGHMEGKCYEAFRRPEGLNMASPLLSSPLHSRPALALLAFSSWHQFKALHAFVVAKAQHRHRKTRAETGAEWSEKHQSNTFFCMWTLNLSGD